MDELSGALIKKAKGFTEQEVTEEFSEQDGELRLTKRRVVHKVVPPDLAAIKAVWELQENEFSHLTDQQLEQELERLKGEVVKQKKEDKNDCKSRNKI